MKNSIKKLFIVFAAVIIATSPLEANVVNAQSDTPVSEEQINKPDDDPLLVTGLVKLSEKAIAKSDTRPIEQIIINALKQNNKPVVAAKPAVVLPTSNTISQEEIKAKICQVFVNNCSEALIIVKHESGFRQYAVSRTNDYGLFQLNCRWQSRRVGGDCTRFFDIDTNIRVAKQIFNEQGWNPWTTKIFLKK